MQLTPTIATHMTAALLALALGPVALWARQGAKPRPRLHRAMGYAWAALMVAAAVTAVFIRDYRLPNLAGLTAIHLFIPATLLGLGGAFWALRRKNISRHRKIMQQLYFGACLIPGLFTLLPSRYLGQWVWGRWLGWV